MKLSFFLVLFLIISESGLLKTAPLIVNDPNLYDVIIVGGGVSGLGVLSTLAKNYSIKNTLLLEGSGRLGGRINTIPFGNKYIELGAQWIHGDSTKNPIFNMMKSLGQIANYEFYGDYNTIVSATQNGVLQSKSVFSSLSNDLSSMYDALTSSSSLSSMSVTQNFGSLLDSKFKSLIASKYSSLDPFLADSIYKSYINDQLSEYAVNSFYNLSARWIYFNDDYSGNQDTNLKDGYFKLIDYLSLNLNQQIKLNEIVTNIDTNQADKTSGCMITVKALSKNGTVLTNYKAKQVVSSVSLNVLKNTLNLFTPNLPTTKTASINRLTLGTNNKLFFVYNKSLFTTNTGIAFLWKSNLNFTLNADKTYNLKGNTFYKNFDVFRVPPNFPNILFSEFVGDASTFTETLSDQCLIDVFFELTTKFFPSLNLPKPIQIIRSKWSTNPFIQGSYTYAPPGSSVNDILNLAKPLYNVNKLHFVGEATSTYTGTVHGAYQSGVATAKLISGSIKNKC